MHINQNLKKSFIKIKSWAMKRKLADETPKQERGKKIILEQMSSFCNGINHTGGKWEWTDWGRGGRRLIIRDEMRRKERKWDKEEFDRRRWFPGGERVTCDPSGCSFAASPSLLSPPLCSQTTPHPRSSSSLLTLICLRRARLRWRLGSLENYRWGGRYEE